MARGERGDVLENSEDSILLKGHRRECYKLRLVPGLSSGGDTSVDRQWGATRSF